MVFQFEKKNVFIKSLIFLIRELFTVDDCELVTHRERSSAADKLLLCCFWWIFGLKNLKTTVVMHQLTTEKTYTRWNWKCLGLSKNYFYDNFDFLNFFFCQTLETGFCNWVWKLGMVEHFQWPLERISANISSQIHKYHKFRINEPNFLLFTWLTLIFPSCLLLFISISSNDIIGSLFNLYILYIPRLKIKGRNKTLMHVT